jgi:hypothetical protein
VSVSTTAMSPPSIVAVVPVTETAADVLRGLAARCAASPAGRAGASLRSSRCQETTAVIATSNASGRSPSMVTAAVASVVLVVGACDVVADVVGCVVAIVGEVVESGAASGVDVHAPATSARATRRGSVGMSRFTGVNRTRDPDELRGPGTSRGDRGQAPGSRSCYAIGVDSARIYNHPGILQSTLRSCL